MNILLSDDAGKRAHSTVRYIRGNDDEAEKPSLDVQYDLLELMPFELLGLSTSLVSADALDDAKLLFHSETAGHGIVGEEEESHKSEGDGDESEQEEEYLPGFEVHVRARLRPFSKTIFQNRRRSEMIQRGRWTCLGTSIPFVRLVLPACTTFP